MKKILRLLQNAQALLKSSKKFSEMSQLSKLIFLVESGVCISNFYSLIKRSYWSKALTDRIEKIIQEFSSKHTETKRIERNRRRRGREYSSAVLSG